MLVLVASRNTSIHVQHLMFYTLMNSEDRQPLPRYLSDVVDVVRIRGEEEALAPISLALCKLSCTTVRVQVLPAAGRTLLKRCRACSGIP